MRIFIDTKILADVLLGSDIVKGTLFGIIYL